MHTSLPRPDHARRSRRRASALLAGVVATTALVVVTPSPASAGALPVTTGLVSRSASGNPANLVSEHPEISGNGRFVVFESSATNLVTNDTNNAVDVFVKDRWSQTIERVSVSDTEVQANGASGSPAISDDGRYVAFTSVASNLIPGDNAGLADPFVRDRATGQTIRVASGLGGALLHNNVNSTAISGNGRYVAFTTLSSNVVVNDTNGDADVFLRDLYSNDVERVSISPFETQGEGNSANPSISDDGRYVAFDSEALLAGGAIGTGNDYVRDRTAGTTILVNVNTAEEVANDGGGGTTISGNGRYVVFGSAASNLVAGDTNAVSDVFRRDLQDGVTTRVSLADNDTQLPLGSFGGTISDDGSQVGFVNRGTLTAAVDAGPDADLFVRNIATSSTRRVSVGTAADPAGNIGAGTSLSDDGRSAAFQHPIALSADNKLDQIYVNDQPSLGPFNGADQFINHQIMDFLGRYATTEERTMWKDRFARGSATPPTLIATLAVDPVFSAKRAPVVRLYWAFFLRKPDPSGLTYWIGKYQGGASLSSIAQKFAQSSEFKNRYGSLTNQAYVKQVYLNVFERQPDPSGLTYWTGKLDRGEATRGGVLVQFSESSEGVRRLAPQVNITLISQGMLGVSPSATYWDHAFAVYEDGEKELAWLAGDTLETQAYAMRID